ncbi:hypothetical protein [Mesomycoplasma ovipneumoniae]|uniref:hypothetical protein n=1 Tax=Mesomycoplasma ovipneumoniae TaxID=29562 RepID=UPI001E483F70|nr:hypothetical protein [Mesomycoplasma ovipneumoniae]
MLKKIQTQIIKHHPAWFFNFHTEGLKSYFVISEKAIPEPAAWLLAVGSLTMQSKLTQIVIDNFLPSSVKAEMNKKDRDNMKEKLNSPIDFYSLMNRYVKFDWKNKRYSKFDCRKMMASIIK